MQDLIMKQLLLWKIFASVIPLCVAYVLGYIIPHVT